MANTTIVEQMKLEVLRDMQDGIIPETVRSFSELHDYVDANEYGGFCDDASPNSTLSIQDMDDVQEVVHQWLCYGGHLA